MNRSNEGFSVSEFVKAIKSSKDMVFHLDDIPKNNQTGQIHVVALQMFGKGIVKLTVTDKTKVGSPKMISSDIIMKVCVKDVEQNGRLYSTPCYTSDKYWNRINVDNCN